MASRRTPPINVLDSRLERLVSEGCLDEAPLYLCGDYPREWLATSHLATLLLHFANLLAQRSLQLQLPVWRICGDERAKLICRPKMVELIGLLMRRGADPRRPLRIEEGSDLLAALQMQDDDDLITGDRQHSQGGNVTTVRISSGWITCIGLGVFLGDARIVEALMSTGTDINRSSRGKVTVSGLSHQTVGTVTCPHEKDLMSASGNLTPFLMAAWGGILTAVNHFASLGMDTTACCSKGNAVHLAILSGNQDVLLRVIELGCDIDMVSAQGNTPLHLAARLDRSDLCQTLVTHGALLDTLDKNGETALSSSVYFGREKNSLLLIQHGADLYIADSRGTTPLYWSIFTYRVHTLQKLVEAGIQCTLQTFRSYPRNLRIMRDRQLLGWLRSQWDQPKSLQQLSSLGIRDILKRKAQGRSIMALVDSLPLPRRLQSYVGLL